MNNMKINKHKFLLFLSFLAVFLAGIATMRIVSFHQSEKNKPQELPPPMFLTAPSTDIDLKNAQTAEGFSVVDPLAPQYVDDSELPSQMAKIQLKGVDHVISRSGEKVEGEKEEEGKEKNTSEPIHLGDAGYVVPSVQAVASTAVASDTKISMIAAPAKALLIKNTEEYKQFKRKALGAYPKTDFSDEYLLTLESTTNLPDKVFEIQDVQEENGKMVVVYRVSVFGLDKKTNSHHVVRIAKKDLPIELKQVL